MTAPALHVYEYHDCDSIVAASEDDAWAAMVEHYGEDLREQGDTMRLVPNDEPLAICCYADGTICPIDDDECADVVTRTAGEWAQLHGRGWLCSTEY